jgi:hypothetical protein
MNLYKSNYTQYYKQDIKLLLLLNTSVKYKMN